MNSKSTQSIRIMRSMASLKACIVPSVAITSEVKALIEKNALVAIGVSGGKDSQACALAVNAYLDAVGHTGERVLVHSDLGRTEWKAGDEFDYRGEWEAHAFVNHPDVANIEKIFAEGIAS